MADVLTGVTETQATGMDLISSIVQEALVQEAVLFPLVQQYSAPMGVKQVEIPRSDLPSVSTKTENTQIDAQALTFATDALALDQHKAIQYLVEDIARAQANIPLIEDLLMKASKKLAEDMDDYVYEQLKLASASNPDHRVAYNNSGSADTMGKEDILNARKLLNIQSVPQDSRFLAINPLQESELLAIDTFVEADKYGATTPLYNGELGRLFGFRVVMTNVVDSKEAVAFHQSACAFARQIAPKVESDRDLANLSDRLSISHLYGAKVLDSGKRCVKLGTAS